MEIRVLRYFLTVVREESITKASEVLHITQPTLSRQLAQMEEEIGVKLFDRGTRKIKLTNEGILLRRRAEEILQLVDKTEKELVEQEEQVEGRISIGCGEIASVQLLPKLFQTFHQKYPRVTATNTTKGVAENLAGGLGADLYEIVPETPYTDADLNYHDDNSRTTIEMNDPNARPAISGSVENMEQYDIVFIGYPIWWGQAPKIIYTFMESYDFSGKTIVPFCTSGSSGVGSSATNLQPLANNAIWLPGKRFSGSASQSTIMECVKGLGLNLGE